MKSKNRTKRLVNKPRDVPVYVEKTVGQILDELELSSESILISVNGQVLLPGEIMRTKVIPGDKVRIIPVFVGG